MVFDSAAAERAENSCTFTTCSVFSALLPAYVWVVTKGRTRREAGAQSRGPLKQEVARLPKGGSIASIQRWLRVRRSPRVRCEPQQADRANRGLHHVHPRKRDASTCSSHTRAVAPGVYPRHVSRFVGLFPPTSQPPAVRPRGGSARQTARRRLRGWRTRGWRAGSKG